MRIGIIGLPNSGKTTSFNVLTGGSAPTAAYTGGTFQVMFITRPPEPTQPGGQFGYAAVQGDELAPGATITASCRKGDGGSVIGVTGSRQLNLVFAEI